MRRTIRALVVGLVGAMLFAPAAAARPNSPFVGSWIGADPAPPVGDGSTLFLSISGGETAQISFTDLSGNICVVNDAPTEVFSSRLTGSQSGNELHSTFASARCGSLYFDWLVGVHTTYEYDPSTDSISDGFATFFRR